MNVRNREYVLWGKVADGLKDAAQEPRIVAECWTCGIKAYAIDIPPDPTLLACQRLGHDVRPIEPQKGE